MTVPTLRQVMALGAAVTLGVIGPALFGPMLPGPPPSPGPSTAIIGFISPGPSPTARAAPSATPRPTVARSPAPTAPPTHRPTTAPARSAPPSTGIPAFDHIFVIVEENRSFGQVIGNASAPYLNSLAARYGLATSYHAIRHPSLPNYLALVGGSTFGIGSDCSPSSCPVRAPMLGDRLTAAGRSWRAYIESMPQACATAGSGSYAPRHNPFVYFTPFRSSAACRAHDVPYGQLATDLRSASTTPAFAWITPNLCNDMHDCSVATGDAWLRAQLATIFASPAWTSQNSLVVITWDEDDFTSVNRVATILVGRSVRPGYRSGVGYNHYSLLRTIEVAFRLPPLTANDGGARPMADFFR